jgi:hypothetical protein
MARTTRHATMQRPEGVRDKAGCGNAGFRWRPWEPQENSSLGKALDPKLEGAGRGQLPALASRGFCARIGDG